MEARAGAFLHAELAPTNWVTVTGGARLDYNTVTGVYTSPRLAAVFRPAPDQFLRAGVARAFRKPSFQETHMHPDVEFPDDSPITGPARDNFREFMSKVLGNSELENEDLWSFEAGYLGRFWDGKLSVFLDLYYNLHTNLVSIVDEIVTGDQGLPDLERSKLCFENRGRDMRIFGGELGVRYAPSRRFALVAWWSHREVLHKDTSPKNLIAVGGRFQTSFGLLGSLYGFSRSEFRDREVNNPEGLMAPLTSLHMDNVLLVLARLGWRWEPGPAFELEAGVKLFLPVSPFSAPHFRYYERGGGTTTRGVLYGGQEISRCVTAYLQGAF